MAKKETLILFAKDFFGDALDATISFEQDGRTVHTDSFTDGWLHVTLPDQLEPGVYDLVARREDAEYRVNSFMVPLATHYFCHAQLHGDIKLKGGNFSGPPIQRRKFNPLLHHYIDSTPPDLLEGLDEVALYNANPDSLRRGGTLHVEEGEVVINRGESAYKGKIYFFPETRIPIPTDLGIYKIGIVSGNPVLLITGTPDVHMATLRVEGPDWVRVDVALPYHVIYRGGYSYFFTDYEKTTEDVEWLHKGGENLTGLNHKGKIYGNSWSSRPVSRVKLQFQGEGPVVKTDRLYVYATPEYFLLWEGDTLLTALPRWDGSTMTLEWGEDRGLSFDSYGGNGHNRFSIGRPYSPSHVQFREGLIPIETEKPLGKKVTGFNVLAANRHQEWGVKFRTGDAQLLWDGDDITSTNLPNDDLFPGPDLLPD